MGMQEDWLARFKAVVASEIEAAGGKEADGYRAVEAKTGLGYDYIYQIYKGKPAHQPKMPSADAMNTIARVYAGDKASNLSAPSYTPDHWRRVADVLATELHGQRVDPAAFLSLADLLAEVVPASAPDREIAKLAVRHLRLVA